MKKTGIILLLCIYALSTFGVSINHFYCCGKLKSIYLTLHEDNKTECDKKGCCKTEHTFLKINDSHASADVVACPPLYFTTAYINNGFLYAAPLFTAVYSVHDSNAPPISQPVPYYKLHCLYRI